MSFTLETIPEHAFSVESIGSPAFSHIVPGDGDFNVEIQRYFSEQWDNTERTFASNDNWNKDFKNSLVAEKISSSTFAAAEL